MLNQDYFKYTILIIERLMLSAACILRASTYKFLKFLLFSFTVSNLISSNALAQFQQRHPSSTSPAKMSIENESAHLFNNFLLKNLSPASSEIQNPELKRLFEEQYSEIEKVDFLLDKMDLLSPGSEEEDFITYFNQSMANSSRLTRDFAINAKQLAKSNYSRESIAKIELNSSILNYVFRKYNWSEKNLPSLLKQKVCSSLEGLILASEDNSKKIQLYYLNSLVEPLELTEGFYCNLKDNQIFYLKEEMYKAMLSLDIDTLEKPTPIGHSLQSQIYDYQLIPNTELKIDIDENIAFCQPEEQLQSTMESIQAIYNILAKDQSWRANMSDLIISFHKGNHSECNTRHRFQGRITRDTVITEEVMQTVLDQHFAK